MYKVIGLLIYTIIRNYIFLIIWVYCKIGYLKTKISLKNQVQQFFWDGNT